jgi:NADPH:quinone reductase-like Zn-dependent oxidoreductase
LGADEIILRDATLPKRCFDVVLDLVGGARWGHLLDSLVMGGRYVVAGAIAGPIVELDLRTLYLRDLSFFGCTYQPDNIFSDLVGYIERGEISPMLARTYPLRDMRVAQEFFLAKSHVGKIGITVSSKV